MRCRKQRREPPALDGNLFVVLAADVNGGEDGVEIIEAPKGEILDVTADLLKRGVDIIIMKVRGEIDAADRAARRVASARNVSFKAVFAVPQRTEQLSRAVKKAERVRRGDARAAAESAELKAVFRHRRAQGKLNAKPALRRKDDPALPQARRRDFGRFAGGCAAGEDGCKSVHS